MYKETINNLVRKRNHLIHELQAAEDTISNLEERVRDLEHEVESYKAYKNIGNGGRTRKRGEGSK